ncbi:hypothetical protein O6P43_007476 [Quillaja saponaria]|uniref:Uncharacterized protein n=1 Tax=Quillaja saponaria TaxID=32244 RepID=A0AAD7QAR0_QUISA|nr:hypothetical protein O6P43_007476 [Quillaja saponaria]
MARNEYDGELGSQREGLLSKEAVLVPLLQVCNNFCLRKWGTLICFFCSWAFSSYEFMSKWKNKIFDGPFGCWKLKTGRRARRENGSGSTNAITVVLPELKNLKMQAKQRCNVRKR